MHELWYATKSTSWLPEMWRTFWKGKTHTHTLFERIPTKIGRLSVCVNLKYDSQMNPQTHRIDTYLSYSFWLFFFPSRIRRSQYTCLVCNLFDDEDKDQYHCDGCGICRIGGRTNFFHCEVCNMCLPLQLKTNGHRVSIPVIFPSSSDFWEHFNQ